MSEKYFVHDELSSDIEYFDTFQDALKHAKNCINDSCDDGLPEELIYGGLKIGIVTHESTEVNKRPIPLNEDGEPENTEFDYYADIEMIEVSR